MILPFWMDLSTPFHQIDNISQEKKNENIAIHDNGAVVWKFRFWFNNINRELSIIEYKIINMASRMVVYGRRHRAIHTNWIAE